MFQDKNVFQLQLQEILGVVSITKQCITMFSVYNVSSAVCGTNEPS